MEYIYVQITPDRIEDGNYEVNGDELRVEHAGGGVSKCTLRPGEDPKRAARELLREHYKERGGSFWEPLPPPKSQV
jgi:hypothetical protein